MSEKVSILIPNYNSKKFLEQVITSALNQTYRNIEVVIVDNCSTDDSWNIIKRFASKDNRIKAFRNDENIGPVRNWQRCIDHASGYYAKFLWSDDYIADNFIENTIDVLRNPDVGFVFTKTIHFHDQNGEKQTIYNIGKSGIYSSDMYQYGVLIEGDFPKSPGCGLFRLDDLRKNLLESIPNKINSHFAMHAIGNDVLVYLLTSSQYPFFGYIDKPLSFFRAHEQSITISTRNEKLSIFYAIAKAYFVENHINNMKIIKKFNTNLYILLKKYKNNDLKVNKISDFYMENRLYSVDHIFLFKRLLRKFFKMIIRRK